ncbi:MAG: DUF1425 domain-containing protein [Planctomycetota bacterium]
MIDRSRAVTLVLASLAGGFTLTGCAPATPVAPAIDPVAYYPQLVIEPSLYKFLVVDYGNVVVEPRTSMTPLRVLVPVRSQARQQFSVQHRYIWYDDRGREIGDTGWRFAAMEPGLREQFTQNATSQDAVDWVLEIRSAR